MINGFDKKIRPLLVAAGIGLMLFGSGPAPADCGLPGHGSGRGIPPVSFPCSAKEMEQMTSDAIEEEQAACRAAAESRGIDCGKHDWRALAEEQEKLIAELEKVGHDLRKAWPEFKRGYVSACQGDIITSCSAKTLKLLKAIAENVKAMGAEEKNKAPSIPDFAQNFRDGFAVGQCSVEVAAPFFTEGTRCVDQAAGIHSRILNNVTSQKYDAERRRDEFLAWDAKARNNPECQCPGAVPSLDEKAPAAETEAGS